ncbi:Uncharacterised protein [Klebsiella quasipneumoniae]|uniref:hypothetical protein n=1 Tax=Klebsiella/Raoultella group TaxID=2890311 RepID=UPI001082E76E|nr:MULTISPECIES: hypothetical protein [Klebsiella]HBU6975046.1 hypothetical protein [Raoultella planticola]HCD6356759.1 hypothetical protein [Klebsiella variicola]MBQ5019463.1 hypothetical protein [Klebsiella pneumoniae]MBQ5042180.1 hypothetical protein [Klebsiella pneumoniae]VGD85459.1 Uncharacterised protein [Klebsiella quasipneumoniae]
MPDLPKSIQVIFKNNPMLEKLIPNPVFVSNSPLHYAFNQILNMHTSGSEKDTFYRVVFKKDSSRELMNISSGELRGLSTTACVERGRISDIAGLEKVNIDNTYGIMSALLGISLYGSIYNNLSYISNLCSEIRNHQIIEEQSRFERISEAIVDSFRCIPDLAFDRSMRDIYLSRIVRCNDDCFEIYISQREQFKKLLKSEPDFHSTGFNYFIEKEKKFFYPDRFFEGKILTHSVFSVFERLVAGRMCEIIISGNYSDNNINRHKDFIFRIKRELEALMNYRLTAFNNFTEEKQNEIDTNLNLNGYEREKLKNELTQHKYFSERINAKLDDLLNSRYNSFEILSHIMGQDEIDVLLIDGKLLISSPDLASKKGIQRT